MTADPPPLNDAIAVRLAGALGAGFVLERELGGGGMSHVFVAREVALDRRVVVKVLPDRVLEGLSADRFRREILLSAGLQHPNIVPVIAAGDADGLPYFVMPFVEGESLRARLQRAGAVAIPDTIAILRDVARALAYAHGRGIIHRDIKPDNILLTGGAAVVADFGVAKAIVDAASGSAGPDAGQTLTRIGMSLGTPAYMAPEQIVADPNTDQRADLYALGVMAFEMLTGAAPFTGSSVSEVMTAHLTKVAPLPSSVRAGVPEALDRLVADCLEKDPAMRLASAQLLAQRLEDPAVVSGAVRSMAAVAALAPARRIGISRRMLAVGALVLTALAGGAWWYRGRATTPMMPSVAVLPFTLASSDTSDAYLAQGIADEVSFALGRVDGVRVASKLIARGIASSPGAAQDAARKAGITHTLEGTVQRRGDRIRVTASLITVADGFAAWSETYDRTAAELAAVQGDIAAALVAVVRADLAKATSARTERRDAAAYDDYLRGHFLLQRRGANALRDAIAALERAVQRDTTFARAYAELAQAYAVLPLYTGGGGESFPTAERVARRALALDDQLATAHAALGYLQGQQWQWEDGRRSLERAVALDASDATAWQWLGENAMITGDFVRARDAFAEAARLDAQSGVIGALHALTRGLAGDTEGAIAAGRRAVDADPSQAVTRYMLGTLLVYAGRDADAVSELQEALRLAPGLHPVLGTLGHAHARLGHRAEAQRLLAELRRAPERPGAYPAMAKILTALGDDAGAVAALKRAAAAHDPFFGSEPLGSPLFAGVRAHPSFAVLATTLRLPSLRSAR